MEVKVSSRNQIVVPSEARRRLGINPGDRLKMRIVGDTLVIMRKPEDWVEYTRGIHREIWEGIDVEEYINEERDAWSQ